MMHVAAPTVLMFSSASMRRRVWASLAVAISLGCAVINAGCFPYDYGDEKGTVRATAPLQRVAPKLTGTLPPLPKDMGRVVFGCIDHKCKVTEVLVSEHFVASGGGGFAVGNGSKTRVLCEETPCWADLSYGPHTFNVQSNDVKRCSEPGFYKFEREGYCTSNATEITATATTRPVVVLVRPTVEHHVPKKSLREIFQEAHLAFEMDDGSYGN